MEYEKLPPFCSNPIKDKDNAKDIVDSCFSDGNIFRLREPITKNYVLDVNKGSRTDYYRHCMKRKGWVRKYIFIWEK
jgi:hypothetical protein